MGCQSDIDCLAGFSCRSKTGGGTECRAKGNSNIPMTSTKEEKSDNAQNPQTIQSKSAIEQAKETCTSLGFKSKTEKFGNCVLKLTK